MKHKLIIILLLITNHIFSQSIIGLKGGFYHAEFFDLSSTPHYAGTYKSYDKYAFSLIYKGRKEKKINLGLSLDLQPKMGELHFSYGGLGYQITRDFKVKMWFLYLGIFPELKIGQKFSFNLSLGPQFGIVAKAQKDGQYKTFSITSGPSGPYPEGESAMNEFRGVDLRLFTNIGFEVPINQKVKITFDGTISRGLSNIAKGYGDYALLNTNDYGVFIGLIYKLDNYNLVDKIKKYLNEHKPT
jgi:hypothetical protein